MDRVAYRETLSLLRRAGAAWLTGIVVFGAVSWLVGGANSNAEGSSAAPQAGSAAGAFATLSNLRTFSRWAYPQAPAAVLRLPSPGARVVDHLRFLTGDGQAQVYLALRSYTTGTSTWIKVSVPRRPNGIAGWVPAAALGKMHVTSERLRVNREQLRATLYRDGQPIWRAPVGIGRSSLPTPAGHFYVTEKLTALGGAFYGPYAIGTSAYAPTLSEWPGGGVIGIHGTDEPQLIPGHPSHGCIRLRNSDIARLWRMIDVGTPIEIV
jgi:lipoprotein-anchoring transpeptidase ErfK/SrfK